MDRPALHAGIRAAIAVSAGFAIGRYALDDPQFAVFAGFTAMALLAFADYGGPMRSRLLAFAVTVAVAIGLVSLGTAVSESSWGGPVAVGAAAVVVAYAAVLGGYFVAGTNAVILFAVLAAGIPAPDGALDSRVVGTLLGGALAAAASVLLWPARPVRDAGRPLGKAAAALAACLGAGAADREASLAAARTEVRAARARLGDLRHRPSEPTARHRAILRLVADLDRLLGRIAGLVRHGPPPPGPGRGFLDAAEAGLAATAASLSGRRPPGDPVDLERRVLSCIPRARAALADRVVEADTATVAREAEETAIAGEVAQAATMAALDAEIVAGRRPRSADPAVLQLLDEPLLEAARRRLRANLTLRSVYLRNALRLGVALALALVHALDLQHGFWVVLATLAVVRTTASATSVTAGRAVLGTAVGFALAVLIILGAEADSHLYIVLLGLVIFAAVYAARAGGVLAGQAAFTVFVVVLFSLLAPATWTLAVVRVEDFVAGALVGVAIGLIAWPRGAGGQLPGAVAEVADRAADEVESAARRQLGRGGGGDAAALRAATLTATRRAEDDLAVALGER
ncbi:MAG: FUSC family protein, partial [Thermoleophilia bacterium]